LRETSAVGLACTFTLGNSDTLQTGPRIRTLGRGVAIGIGGGETVVTTREPSEVIGPRLSEGIQTLLKPLRSRMANVDSSDAPPRNAGEHPFSLSITYYVNIHAPTSIHTTPASATAESRAQVASSSTESEAAQRQPGDPLTVAPHLRLINLESVKLRRRSKRRFILEYLIGKLQRLLAKVP
jgi:hypothetical protein